MRNIFFVVLLFASLSCSAQERYVGLTRDSIVSFHAKNFEQLASNDTALLVKNKRDGLDWRYFWFDKAGKCTLASKEVPFYNDFTDLEKKMKKKKYKDAGEVEYDFIKSKVKGTLYSNGKENYVLMYKPINPNLSATTRAIVYYKTK